MDMSKETKQDRIVRTISDQVHEHLHELKNIDGNPNSKESDVERWCASFLKNCFGYMASSGYSIRSQEAKGKMRPDLIILKNDKPIFVVEVKKTSFDLHKSDFRSGKVQLSEYLSALGNVNWGMLTNGVEWKLYDFSNPQFGGIEIGSFNLKFGEDDTYAFDKKSVEDLCYEIIDFHESRFADNSWEELSKEAMVFSPESLARAILSSDVVKYVSKCIKGEHEYKANIEALTDKVYWLLENGLNDTIGGWNEAKSVEFQKYIKAQKRAQRKTKKINRKITAVETVAPLVTESIMLTAEGIVDKDKKVS
jgi:hypothetical protein